MNEPAEILECRVLVETPRVRFERRRERLPNGKVADRDVLVHPGAAVIVPVLPDGRLVLLRQYRSTISQWILEFPAGTLEPGEDPAVTAARELTEETGHRARAVEPLLQFYPAPGVTDELMHGYVATGLTEGSQSLDDTECLEVLPYAPAELEAAIAAGQVVDGKTIVMYFAFQQRLRQETEATS